MTTSFKGSAARDHIMVVFHTTGTQIYIHMFVNQLILYRVTDANVTFHR